MNDQDVAKRTSTEPAETGGSERTLVLVVYILYAVAFLTSVTALVGVVIAYLQRGKVPAWLQSHYTFQIRTFWISLAAIVIGGILSFIAIGFLVLAAWFVWAVVRIVVGLIELNNNRPIADPESWWTGRQ